MHPRQRLLLWPKRGHQVSIQKIDHRTLFLCVNVGNWDVFTTLDSLKVPLSKRPAHFQANWLSSKGSDPTSSLDGMGGGVSWHQGTSTGREGQENKTMRFNFLVDFNFPPATIRPHNMFYSSSTSKAITLNWKQLASQETATVTKDSGSFVSLTICVTSFCLLTATQSVKPSPGDKTTRDFDLKIYAFNKGRTTHPHPSHSVRASAF